MKFRGDVLFLSFIWVNVWLGSLRKQIYMRPVETESPQQIGVLATDATLKADFYQEKLCSEVYLSVRYSHITTCILICYVEFN